MCVCVRHLNAKRKMAKKQLLEVEVADAEGATSWRLAEVRATELGGRFQVCVFHSNGKPDEAFLEWYTPEDQGTEWREHDPATSGLRDCRPPPGATAVLVRSMRRARQPTINSKQALACLDAIDKCFANPLDKYFFAACARALGFDADTVELRLFLPGEVRKIGGGPKVKYVLFTLEVVLGAIGPASLVWEWLGCGGSEPTTLSSALLQRCASGG